MTTEKKSKKKTDTGYSSGSGLPSYGSPNLEMLIRLNKLKKEREKKLREYQEKKKKEIIKKKKLT